MVKCKVSHVLSFILGVGFVHAYYVIKTDLLK